MPGRLATRLRLGRLPWLEIAMNHTTPDMIEIKSLSTSMIEDGTDALVTCLVKKEGMVRLKMNRAVLEGFCKEAVQELARKRMPASGD